MLAKGVNLALIQSPFIDLEKTLNSGQVFHWTRHKGGFIGAIGEQPVYVQQKKGSLLVTEGCVQVVQHYLALDHSLDLILSSFPQDSAFQVAKEFGSGMRIVRQPIWECLATFLTSAMKRVEHIRAISLSLRRMFGRSLQGGGFEVYAYPRPEVLAEAPMGKLLECKLGFRARNLSATAKRIHSEDLNLEYLKNAPTSVVREELCSLPGVGKKIANCVLLFAYGRLDVVPID
ncbi:MAG: hypothetical protein JO076_11780, partial [Verrucomicrobia bacterium]|nr:hypothetical protein [Verrucomicrobiota bacterium]